MNHAIYYLLIILMTSLHIYGEIFFHSFHPKSNVKAYFHSCMQSSLYYTPIYVNSINEQQFSGTLLGYSPICNPYNLSILDNPKRVCDLFQSLIMPLPLKTCKKQKDVIAVISSMEEERDIIFTTSRYIEQV